MTKRYVSIASMVGKHRCLISVISAGSLNILVVQIEDLLAKSSVLINFPQLPDVVVFLFPEFVDGVHK